MDILKNKKFKATTWLDGSRIVEGTLQIADFRTNEPADPQTNKYGYNMIIVDESGDRHLIAPDTLEVVENPHFSTITQYLFDRGLTINELELFWSVSMESAINAFGRKNSGNIIIIEGGRGLGKTQRLKKHFESLIKANIDFVENKTYSTIESSSKYFNKPKDNFKK